MNIRKVAFPLLAVVTITACDGLKDALTAHTDVVARVERNELSVNRLADLMGNSALQIQTNRDVAGILTDLWVSYQLLGVAGARGDSLRDTAAIDEATLGMASQERLRRFMAHIGTTIQPDSANEALYQQAPGGLLVARHILFKFPGTTGAVPGMPGGATQQQKDSVRRAAEAVRPRVTLANFNDMARRYSGDDQNKNQGGDLGAFPRSMMVKPFSDAVAALRPGEISPPVETQFGYHIILRPTYTSAKAAFDQAYYGMAQQAAESAYVARIDSGAQINVRSNAGATAKNVARDLGSHRNDNDVLATYRGGQLTVARFVTWVESFNPQMRIAQQLSSAQVPDSIVKNFVKVLARNEVMLKMADSAGITLDPAERARTYADFGQFVMNVQMQLGIDPRSLADSAQNAPERERVAAQRVDAYIQRIMQGQAQPITVPAAVQSVLMAKYDSKIYPAGLDRAVQRATTLRASADSTRAAQPQPPSQVPLPTPPAPAPTGGTTRP
jgi:hypothetical protein